MGAAGGVVGAGAIKPLNAAWQASLEMLMGASSRCGVCARTCWAPELPADRAPHNSAFPGPYAFCTAVPCRRLAMSCGGDA